MSVSEAKLRLGDILLTDDKSECRAFWRAADGAPDVFLCAINSEAYDKHAQLPELFFNLAGEVAVNLDRPAGSGVTLQRSPVMPPSEVGLDRSGFPCWECTDPCGVDARHQLNSYSDGDLAAQLSPG